MTAAPDTTEELEAIRLDLDAVTMAVGRLPKECRKAFVLRLYHGLSLEELTVRCGIPLETVKASIEGGLELARAHRRERANSWSH